MQGDRKGVFDFCCTDARRTPDWLRAGRTPEALRPLATCGGGGGGRDDIPAPFSALSDEAIEILRNLDSPRYYSASFSDVPPHVMTLAVNFEIALLPG